MVIRTLGHVLVVFRHHGCYRQRVSKRQITLRLDPELLAAVRALIGATGLMTDAVTEALQLWIASKHASSVSVPDAAHELPALPWNAYRPPRSTQA